MGGVVPMLCWLSDGGSLALDLLQDPNIIRNGRMDMLSLKEYRSVQGGWQGWRAHPCQQVAHQWHT